jgi:hypothetical protein
VKQLIIITFLLLVGITGSGQDNIDTTQNGFDTPEALAKSLFKSFQNFSQEDYIKHIIPLDADLYLYNNHFLFDGRSEQKVVLDSLKLNYKIKVNNFNTRAKYFLKTIRQDKKINLKDCKIVSITYEPINFHYWPATEESFVAPFAYIEMLLKYEGNNYYLEIPQVVQLQGKWFLKYPEYHLRDQAEHDFLVQYLEEVDSLENNPAPHEYLFLNMMGNAIYLNGDTALDYNIYALLEGDTIHSSIQTDSKFNITFPLGKKYVLGFKKDGYIAKHLILDIIDCGEYIDQKYGFDFPMELKLIEGDSSIPSINVATIGYNPETGYMEIISRIEQVTD